MWNFGYSNGKLFIGGQQKRMRANFWEAEVSPPERLSLMTRDPNLILSTLSQKLGLVQGPILKLRPARMTPTSSPSYSKYSMRPVVPYVSWLSRPSP